MSVWSLADALTYFQEDPEIKEVLTTAEFNDLVNQDAAFLKLLRTALEFQGFDPRSVMKQLIRNRLSYDSKNKTTIEWDLSNVNGKFMKTETSKSENMFTNKESLAKDLEFLIMMFLLRNNHITKIIEKSVEGLSDILSMLKEKYEIDDETRKSGTSLSAREITLPRITGVLPSVAVKMFHDQVVKETVSYVTIPGVAELEMAKRDAEDKGKATSSTGHSAITHAICCPFLPSLHPITKRDESNIHALNVVCCHSPLKMRRY